MPLITINQVQKYYGNNHVLKGVDLDIDMGQVISIIGRSGSGKSTLLRCINGLEGYQDGSIKLGGMTITDRDSQAREISRSVGMVFQSFNLIDELNVFENIELPLLYMGIPAAERKRRVEDAMNRMAIAHRVKHFPQQLSGGQQQRVAIARAVVANPKLILADEPTGNLDSKNGKEVMELLTELNKEGTTIVMVTHSQHDSGYAGRTINLFDGQVVNEIKI